jgi:glycosyltransferase involved in cell wall biosynthesis
MTIGIDTFACGGGRAAVGAYALELLKRVPPSGARFELFGWDCDRFTFTAAAPGLEFISRCAVNGKTANALWHMVRFPAFAAGRGWNGCFFPAAHRLLPRASPCPAVGTVHDMAAWVGARGTREHLGFVIRASLFKSLRRLDRIIAVSGWVKQELIALAGVKESAVEVIPNGIDLALFHPRPRGDKEVLLIQPFSFRRPYILYAARLEHPVKNHIRLIEAFGIFKERTKYPHRLVLAGADSEGAGKIREAAAASPHKGDIFFTGYFPSESLPELYAAADLVVIPSLYEGFGMGALEALASGVPLACARAAALPEAAGDSALYFDPLDTEDMADRMVTLLTDRALHRESGKAGLERAKSFSWDTCAAKTFALLQETAATLARVQT